MTSRVGYLHVTVPPDILVNESSSDQVVKEGSNVTLLCAATGYPAAKITWRREDNRLINGHDVLVEGSTLNFIAVGRHQMGAYLCIASNGVPPSVSKRIMLQVEFAPALVPMESERSPNRLGEPLVLHCQCRSYPLAFTYWTHETARNRKDAAVAYYTHTTIVGLTTDVYLTVGLMEAQDQGNYTCFCTNPLGSVQQTITVKGLDPNHQRRMASDFLADEEDTTPAPAPTTLRPLPDKPRKVTGASSPIPPIRSIPVTHRPLPPLPPLPASSAAPLVVIPAYFLLFALSCHWSTFFL